MEVTVKIKAGKKVVELTEQEMQELRTKLNNLFGEDNTPYVPYYPEPYPQPPNVPWYGEKVLRDKINGCLEETWI